MYDDLTDLGIDVDSINAAANATGRFSERIRQLSRNMEFLLGVQRRLSRAMSIDPEGRASRLVNFGSSSLGFQMNVPSGGVLYGGGINPFTSMRHTIDRMRARNLADDAFIRQFRRYSFFTGRAASERQWGIVPRGTFSSNSPSAWNGWGSSIPPNRNVNEATDAEYTMSGEGPSAWNGWGNFFARLAETRGRMNQANLWRSAGAARGGATGAVMGTIGNLIKFGAVLKSLYIPIMMLGYAFKKLIQMAAKLSAMAEENFRLSKQSASYNMLGRNGNASALLYQQRMVQMLGGDAASVSTLNAKLSADRAMLGYGGNGGAFMEAARLFGLNIFGSGRYGMATNSELMENIAVKMGQLDPESQIAMKNVLGLSDEMFWAMRGGLESYKAYIENSKTFLDKFAEGTGASGIFGSTSDEWMGGLSQEYVNDWNEFKVTMKELGLVLGKTLLPAFSVFLKLVNGFVQALSWLANLFTGPLGWLFKKIADHLDLMNGKVPVTPPLSKDEMNDNLRKEKSLIEQYDNTTASRNSTVSINQVTITSAEPLTNENSVALARGIGNGITDRAMYMTSGLGVWA